MYAVIAYRWGWTNAHNYIVKITDDLETAEAFAIGESQSRGGKYGVTVLDENQTQIYHASSAYGEKASFFNDRIALFEKVGAEAVCNFEDKKKVTIKQLRDKWKKELELLEMLNRIKSK